MSEVVTDHRSADFGADALRFRTSAGDAWVVTSASRIPKELRRTALAGRHKDFRYYELLEETLREQFDYRYFVLQDEASGEWALQPFFLVNQDCWLACQKPSAHSSPLSVGSGRVSSHYA